MGKVAKETRREQRYNANLHNLFVKAQEEIANEQYGRNLCPSHQKDTGTRIQYIKLFMYLKEKGIKNKMGAR